MEPIPGGGNLDDKEISCFYMDPEQLHAGDTWQGYKQSLSLSVSILPSLLQKHTHTHKTNYTPVEDAHKAEI